MLANWNAKEPCYLRLTAKLPSGSWTLADDEHRRVYTLGGKSTLEARTLGEGVYVQCPAFDYLGVRLRRAGPAVARDIAGYEAVKLEGVAQAAKEYSASAGAATAGQADGGLTFDDFDRDGKFEYLVRSADQRVWVSQSGTIDRRSDCRRRCRRRRRE